MLDTSPVSGNDFFFDSADFQHSAAESDFASHSGIPANRNFGKSRNQSGSQGDAGGRTIFGGSSFGDVNVHIGLFVKIFLKPQSGPAGTDVGIGGVSRFFHD